MNDWISPFRTRQKAERTVQCYPAPGFEQPGVKALFFDGPDYQGHATRVFAWYGLPEGADAAHPVPGIVLIHGGGATALADWVRLWNAHGFAALAMDNCGGVPAWSETPYSQPIWPRHAHSGPAGWGKLEESELPAAEQWMFHAVFSVLNARAILSAAPEVISGQIGLTGISWGAVIGAIAASLDPLFSFAELVYGCGFFNLDESTLTGHGESMAQREKWFQLWDPGHYLSVATMPILWFSDAEDAPFPLSAWLQSCRLTPDCSCRRSLRIDYSHDHTICWESKTIFDFARAAVTGQSLPQIYQPEISNGHLIAKYDRAGRNAVDGELCFTRARGPWQDRRWHAIPANITATGIETELPLLTSAAFLRFHDDHGSLWSSDVLEFEQNENSHQE